MTERKQETSSETITENSVLSGRAEKDNAQAVFELDAKLHEKGGKSRLDSLRTSTSGIETQVSIINKGVEHYAG